jgi:hypothetical protein
MVKKIIENLINFFSRNNDDCYETYKSEDNNCYGHVGGDITTGYLADCCITCEHHKFK